MRREATAISPVTEIVAEIKAGRMVVLVDEEDREFISNEFRNRSTWQVLNH